MGGLVSFAGWLFDVRLLTDWEGTGISIQPNTCVAAVAAGSSLLALTTGRFRAVAWLGVFIALIGASTLFEHLTGLDLHIDRVLLFDRGWGDAGVASPGRMGPPASTAWTLIGAGLVLASRSSARARRFVPPIALATASISALGLIGYLYGATMLYSVPKLTGIALQTAAFILATSLGLLVSVPEHGPMRLLASPGAGGVLARRALPAILLVPILVGFVRLRGEDVGLYDTAFGSAVRTLVEIFLLLLLLWWTANAVGHQAKRREKADRVASVQRQRVVDTLESITDAFVTLDGAWRYTYVNVEAERLLGKPRAELLGKSTWDVFPETVGSVFHRELLRAAETRASVAFEEYSPAFRRWFANKVYPTADGLLAVYFEDVTARKHAEGELAHTRLELEAELDDTRLLQNISIELVAREDDEGFYRAIVEAAARILRSDCSSLQLLQAEGGAGGELVLLAHRGFDEEAARFWQRVPLDARATCAQSLRSARRVIVEDVLREQSLEGSEDAEVFARLGVRAVQSTPLISRAGVPLGMISTHWRKPWVPPERSLGLLDILARLAADWIERRQTEKQKAALLEKERAARSEAEKAARLKDEFLATLSHELRTPLNAVIGWAQILKNDVSNQERVRTAVEVIERNGRQQARLITDLLDISRIISGNMRLELQVVSLPAVIDAAIDAVLPGATAKGLTIVRSFGPISEPVCGDPARLQQMVWNLLSNAVKFTSRGGSIRVALAESGQNAEIVVSDDGEGIVPEFLPHVFERFRQGDASTTRRHAGLGLGLAIVKQFAELHGGAVRAASDGAGKGATFVISLPFSTPAESERVLTPAPPATFLELPALVSARLKGVRALVVEDEPDGLTMVKRLLEEQGAEVYTALSSDAAIELLETDRFTVIVSDIGMPGRDGYDLLREVRARGIETPALALTAFVHDADRQRALAAGFQAHIGKPVDTAELVDAVARWSKAAARAPDSSRRVEARPS